MPLNFRRRTACLLASILTAFPGHLDVARADNIRTYGDPPLPLNLRAFEEFVDTLEAATEGGEVAMAKKLKAIGFSCTPVQAAQFQCVRFGCRAGGFLLRGALLQWTVTNYSGELGKKGFHGAAVDYSYVVGCIPKSRIKQQEQEFLSRSGH